MSGVSRLFLFIVLGFTAFGACGRANGEGSGSAGNSGSSAHGGSRSTSGGAAGAPENGEGGGSGSIANGNTFTVEIRNDGVDKIDLLLMVDNSLWMADKQAILADAVGGLLSRLITPRCVNADGLPVGGSADPSGRCGNGAVEFKPIQDIHIGVISSSLGAHGGQTCSTPEANDKGQLLPKVRLSSITTWNDSGFLAWDPDSNRPRNSPPGETSAERLKTSLEDMVLAVDQTGCGFESSLEAWYRFLIDPNPYLSIPPAADTGNQTQPVFADPATPEQNPILVQRKAFLRPDSAVVIVMLSDENDCSVRDDGQGWLVGQQNLNGSAFHLPRSTSQCEANPNDKCCQSCAAVAAASGCPDPKTDPVCAEASTWPAISDSLNLRCFDQKRRFGFDFLYPTSRYVSGLYEPNVPDASRGGQLVRNPLYTGDRPRDRSLVFLAGIVGVPWQDLSGQESWPDGAPLNYLSWEELTKEARWQWLLGDAGDQGAAPGVPLDRLMYETPEDRTTLFAGATHPGLGLAGALQPSTSTGRPNAINGHESNIADNSDLQYACIFKLPLARAQCTSASCDCKPEDARYNRALCDGTTQTYAKAYPSLRELQVLRDFGAQGTHNAIVASVCPKTLANPSDPSYGYNPAMAAIVERLMEALRMGCLPRQLPVESNETAPNFGRVSCSVLEAYRPAEGETCECTGPDRPGRSNASERLKASTYNQLQLSGYCANNRGANACSAYCVCELHQFTGDELTRCQTELETPNDLSGFCYVDPSLGTSLGLKTEEQKLVASCPATEKRILRFTGSNVPAKDSVAVLACENPSL